MAAGRIWLDREKEVISSCSTTTPGAAATDLLGSRRHNAGSGGRRNGAERVGGTGDGITGANAQPLGGMSRLMMFSFLF